MSNVTNRILACAKRCGVNYELLTHGNLRSSLDAALETGLPLEKETKTLLLASDQRLFAVTIAADCRINFERFSNLLGVTGLRFASAIDLARLGVSAGGIPPFGFAEDIRSLVSQRVLRLDTVPINPGLANVTMIMNRDAFIELCEYFGASPLDDLAIDGKSP